MTKPFPRQQVFRLTAEELKQVEQQMVVLNHQLESGYVMISPLRECTCLLVLDVVKNDLVLNEVASRFQAAGYLVDVVHTTRGGPAMLRLK